MRQLIAAAALLGLGMASATAADLPVRQYAPPVAAPFSWTGVYIGAHGGYGWGNADQRQTSGGMPEGPFSYDVSGGFGGGTLGANLQAGMFVIGVEGDLGYMGIEGDGRIDSSVPTRYQALHLKGGFYADATVRLGLAVDRVLFYGKGGWAYFDAKASQTTTNPGYVTHATGAFSGWTAGGGVEYAFLPNWSVKLEYLHYDFGKQGGDQTSISDAPIGYVYTNETALKFDTVKAGINYRF